VTYREAVMKHAPILYWPGAESGATVAEDVSGHGRDGTYKNGALLAQPGPLTGDPERAVKYTAASGHRIDANNSYAPFTPGSSMTLMCWAYLIPNATNNRLMGSNGAATARLWLTSGTAPLQFNFDANGAEGGTAAWAGVFPAEGWRHVAVTFDNPGNSAILYLNAASQGAKTMAKDFSASAGVFQVGVAASTNWNGYIGHVALFDRVLSAGDITEIYGAGTTTPPARPPACYQGAVVDGDTKAIGNDDPPYSAQGLEALDLYESQAGKQVGILHISDPWTAGTKKEQEEGKAGLRWDGYGAGASAAVHARGAIVMKSIGGGTNILKEVLEGKHDTSIIKWAQAARAFGHPFFVRPWWEQNLSESNWPWSRHIEHKEAWQYLHRIVKAIAPNATFVWCPNAISATIDEEWIDKTWPGEEFVDWTGLDAYSCSSPLHNVGWKTTRTLLKASYEKLLQLAPNLPIMLGEIAASETGGSKPTWLRNLYDHVLPEQFPRIKAVVYFWNNIVANEKGERLDWPGDSSEASEADYKGGIGNSYYLGPAAAGLTPLTTVPEPGGELEATIETVSPKKAKGGRPHFSHPFRVSDSAATVEQGSTDEITDCVTAALSTEAGSRLDVPDYGIPDETFTQLGPNPNADLYLAAVEAVEPRAHLLGEAAVEEMTKRVTIESEPASA
jgi:phage baseplate assembly protein W